MSAPAGRHRLRRRPRRAAGDRLRGLLSLLMILALLVGVPAALVALRGNPLPAGIDLERLVAALTSPDDGSLFLGALTWIAWAGWAGFAVIVLVEAAAQVRGLPTPRLPALGGPQRAAGALVATALLLFTPPLLTTTLAVAATTAAASTPGPAGQPAPAAAPAAASAPPAIGSSAPSSTTPGSAAASTTALPRYTVQPGDSLWQIAVDQLGAGARYIEIARMNYGTAQPDGEVLTSDHWLRPGWQLQLPADAAAGPADTVVVQPGDTLWQIAQDTLGDGERYPQIAAASTGEQHDGGRLTDPALIRPGWQLTIPADPVAAAAPAAGEPAVQTSPAGPGSVPPPDTTLTVGAPTSGLHPGEMAPAAPPLAPSATPTPTSPAVPESAHPPDAPVGSATGEPAADGESEHAPVRTAAGVGSVLAAGLLLLLGTRRARQQRRRRPGQRIAMPPPELLPAELELRQVEDPAGLHRVDRALRTLSALLGETGSALPALRLARLTGQDLEFYLADPVTLPPPFAPTGDPTVWTLPGDAPLLPPSELAAVPAPYPSLVTLGHDLDGAHVLLDLEHTVSLSVAGAPDRSLAVLAAIAAELATSAWADDLQVTLVGCLPELLAALGSGRVRHVATLTELLPALEHRAAEVHAALADDSLRDLPQARTGTAGQHRAQAWTPEIVLLTGAVAPEDRMRLDAVLQQLPRVGLAAVTAATGPPPDAWTVLLDPHDDRPDATAVLEPIGLTLRPQRLSQADLDQLMTLLAVADLPAQVPTGPAPPTVPLVVEEPSLVDLGAQLHEPSRIDPPPAEQALDVRDAHPDAGTVAVTGAAPPEQPDHGVEPRPSAPLVQVLGPVELLHPRGTVESSKRRQLIEIAAYLALHPGLDHDHLSEAIWPGARTLDNTRNTALSKLRKWLGTDPDGEHYVPRVLGDGYRLHPAVRTDWQLWQQLLPHGPAGADTRALAAAIELVKGKPFAGTNPRRYAWAERDRQDMISAIVDVAHELARRALAEADATLARRAAAAGLQADPGAELLWRDALRAEWLAGDLDGLTRTADRLSALADELGDDLEPETVELLEQLLARPAHPVGAR